MTDTAYKELGKLLGCYLHQDWPEEFINHMSALHAIVQAEPAMRLDSAVTEIDALLASTASETEIGAIITNEVGCYFDPNSVGLTYRQWLKQVRDVFRRQDKSL